MKPKTLLYLFLSLSLFACQNPTKEKNPIAVVRQYYKMLDVSDYDQIPVLLADSLSTQEGDYTQNYSHEQYQEFMKWDAVFNPTYKVLDIVKTENGMVKATVSKTDMRIQFLHEKPIITDNCITLIDGKITKIQINYVDFDYETFGSNRAKLLTFIDENHPELNGFIIDQTEAGGKNYLKALELYKKSKTYMVLGI